MINDPCPSCDGDEYDEAAGECAECGFVLDEQVIEPHPCPLTQRQCFIARCAGGSECSIRDTGGGKLPSWWED